MSHCASACLGPAIKAELLSSSYWYNLWRSADPRQSKQLFRVCGGTLPVRCRLTLVPACGAQAFRLPVMAGGHAALAASLVYQGVRLEKTRFSQVSPARRTLHKTALSMLATTDAIVPCNLKPARCWFFCTCTRAIDTDHLLVLSHDLSRIYTRLRSATRVQLG